MTESDDGVGWGECSALNRSSYLGPSAQEAFDLLSSLPLTSFTQWENIGLAPMVASALEMAALDHQLRASRTSLADHLGATRAKVPAGAALGLAPLPLLAERASQLANEGYRRIKLKLIPATAEAALAQVRTVAPLVEILGDANGSFPSSGVDRLVALIDQGLDAIEQPFAPGETAATQELMMRSQVPVLQDEGVESVADAAALHQRGALGGVSIKPAKAGGLAPSVALHDACVGWGVPATAGGMLESGLGRHALASLAALPGFSVTGDLSPTSRWFLLDPWPRLRMENGEISVPDGLGIAPEPDLELLDELTVRRTDIRPD